VTLLAASPGLRGEPAETPFLVFREPDPASQKLIERDLTEKKLGGHARDDRRQVREEIARIGPWAVPFLAAALAKESSARIRLNAVIALTMIRDPRGLPALRTAAEKDGDISVRRAATLAIGLFEWGEDFGRLKGLLATPRAEWRSIAPALARLRRPEAAALLKAATDRLPKDEHDAAAVVLSAAIVGADAPLVDLLEVREKLVQEAAAMGLVVRPLPPQRAGEIIAALHRSKLAGSARPLAIRALGAIAPRPADARKELLDIACKDGDADERIVALLELEGTADEARPLAKAYGRDGGRDNPLAAALLLALARTREEKAVERLRSVVKGGSDFQRFYAAAALLYANGTARLEEEIRLDIASLGGDLARLAQQMAGSDEAVRKAALGELRYVVDPRKNNLRLFFPPGERNWHEVNRLLTRIFALDEVLQQFDSSRPGRTPESALPGGGSGGDQTHKAPSGTDEEQDLFDLLIPPPVAAPAGEPPYPERDPYFGPEDLGRG